MTAMIKTIMIKPTKKILVVMKRGEGIVDVDNAINEDDEDKSVGVDYLSTSLHRHRSCYSISARNILHTLQVKHCDVQQVACLAQEATA